MPRPRIPPSVDLEHLRSERARVEATLPTLEAELRARRLELKQEELDVERAAGEGLAAFFERLYGSKRELVARERAEAAAARLKFDQSRSALDSARSRLVDMRLRIERQERVQVRVHERLLESGPAQAARVLQLELCEVAEAGAAATEALKCVDWIDESLRSAENWGVFDMFGGGLLATWVKHSRLDQAHERMASLQTALRRLSKELEDIGDRGPDLTPLDGFTRFADYFFDGFFLDWMVQRRISDSIQKTSALRARLTRLRGDLQARERRASEELALLPPA